MNNDINDDISALAERLDIDRSTLNTTQIIALKRTVEINAATKRIQAKIAAGHHRADDLKKRLEQYDVSMEALEIELKTGRPHKVKGLPTDGGVMVNIPPGALKMEGLTNDR